jgi:hypothetical protein
MDLPALISQQTILQGTNSRIRAAHHMMRQNELFAATLKLNGDIRLQMLIQNFFVRVWIRHEAHCLVILLGCALLNPRGTNYFICKRTFRLCEVIALHNWSTRAAFKIFRASGHVSGKQGSKTPGNEYKVFRGSLVMDELKRSLDALQASADELCNALEKYVQT